MRTNIIIDDKLMEEAVKLNSLKTKKKAVELGLKMLIKIGYQKKIKKIRGKLKWIGKLSTLQTDKK